MGNNENCTFNVFQDGHIGMKTGAIFDMKEDYLKVMHSQPDEASYIVSISN